MNGGYYLGNDAQVGLSYPDDTNDLSISQAQLIFQIHDGKQRLIYPSPFATDVLVASAEPSKGTTTPSS